MRRQRRSREIKAAGKVAKRKVGRGRTLDVFRGAHTLSRAPRVHSVRKPPAVGEQKTSREKTRGQGQKQHLLPVIRLEKRIIHGHWVEESGRARLSRGEERPDTEHCSRPAQQTGNGRPGETSLFPRNFTRSQDKMQEDSQDDRNIQPPTR